MTSLARETEDALRALADPAKAAVCQRFFKTGPGQYGAGDVFIGVAVPDQRALAARCKARLGPDDLRDLLASPIHECRQIALTVMTLHYAAARTDAARESLVRLYEAHFERVNNWDLVDLSAPKLTGPWYLGRDRAPLFDWARSDHLWTQRIAVLSSFAFIRSGDFGTTLELADMLLHHPHDLMHKAVGWMLREVGKRDKRVETDFLRPRCRTMPRTMLRYAIEKFPKPEYARWLAGEA